MASLPDTASRLLATVSRLLGMASRHSPAMASRHSPATQHLQPPHLQECRLSPAHRRLRPRRLSPARRLGPARLRDGLSHGLRPARNLASRLVANLEA